MYEHGPNSDGHRDDHGVEFPQDDECVKIAELNHRFVRRHPRLREYLEDQYAKLHASSLAQSNNDL